MSSAVSSDFVDVANAYINDVLTGKRLACKFVKQACRRQLNDLKKFAGSDSPYHFDRDEANRVCRFIELLPHTKGPLARQRIKLEPWQIFCLTTVFGWRSKTGRRYRRVYIEVPRGNGKSSLSSGVALYCLLADRELGADVFSFATTGDQARIVFDDAKTMARMTPALCSKFGLQLWKNSLNVPATNSKFLPKNSEASTLDGLNTHLAVIDELHAHKTRELYDVVVTSLGKRLSSLLWCITTAGVYLDGICREVRNMTARVLAGKVEDETQFGVIYTIDQGDDPFSVKSMEKANPNWGVSVMPDVVESLARTAAEEPAALNNYLTKHLDVWCAAGNAWMNMEKWRACADPSLDLNDFIGRECYIGLDLASKKDLTALALLFPLEDGKYAVFVRHYLPRITIEQSRNSQYKGWERQGLLTLTSEVVTDYRVIKEDILR